MGKALVEAPARLDNLVLRRAYARSLGAPVEVSRRLGSPAAFVAGAIGRDAWEWLVERGWRSDGSSCSLDDIMGVPIGNSGTDYEHANLPARRHDFFYALGRLFQLPESFREAADADYRDTCIARIRWALVGWRRHVGILRARARWVALRWLGGRAWRGEPQARRRLSALLALI